MHPRPPWPALACSLLACGPAVDASTETDGRPGASSSSSDASSSSAHEPPPPTDAVDILLVVDDSGSMQKAQSLLAARIGNLVEPLLAANFRVRFAVTTTDNGNRWCEDNPDVSTPEAGNFVLSSCRSRLDEFFFNGGDELPYACTDTCTLDTVITTPTTTALDPTPRPRPWLELGPGGTNLPAGASATEALHCLVPQGIRGCGFESPLEAARKALIRADTNGEDEQGFLRDDAHLVVLLVSDEADCSFNSDVQDIVFGEAGVGNQVFWSLPDQQDTPTSAVCWNAGVTCTGPADDMDCRPADKAVDGTLADEADPSALLRLSIYRDHLLDRAAARAAHGAAVFTFGILGVPEGYSGSLTYAQAPDGDQPDSVQARFGIAPGCSSRVAQAVPPVRMRELVEQSPWSDNSRLYSVCAEDWGPHLGDIANRILTYAP